MRGRLISVFVVLLLLCSTTFSFAAADPAVTIVNPINNSTTTATNILISVKVTQPKTIRISLTEQKQLINGAYESVDVNKMATAGQSLKMENLKSRPTSMQPVTYTTSNYLTFCTKQVNALKPGVYKVKVETLNRSNRAVYSKESTFVIVTKEETSSKAFENQQSGTFQFLQNILKSIFGS